jgi:hypothetical protein
LGRGVPGCSTPRRRWTGRTWSHRQRPETRGCPASGRVVGPPHLLRVVHLAAGMHHHHLLSRRLHRHWAVARVCGGRGWGCCGSTVPAIESVEEGRVASGRDSAVRGSPEPAGDTEERRRMGRCQGSGDRIECEERDLGIEGGSLGGWRRP